MLLGYISASKSSSLSKIDKTHLGSVFFFILLILKVCNTCLTIIIFGPLTQDPINDHHNTSVINIYDSSDFGFTVKIFQS